MCELIKCPGIFCRFAVGQRSSLLFGVGTLLQSKINREGIRCVDITGGYRK